ncbi:MAG: class I SAM-dependent methyltransferase [Verrucomicrobiae bacterium]|nr:class I SAM-dependent methyltransferase [Verrucomicrobiae bacterium]
MMNFGHFSFSAPKAKSLDLVALNENDGQNLADGWSPEEKDFFMEFFGGIPGEKILDLGCGNGVFSQWLAESGCSVVGLDFSRKAILRASSFQKLSVLGVVENLPFSDASFDRVIFIEVLEHIPQENEEAVIREIFRVLKPNGILVLHTSANIVAEWFCLLLNPLLALLRALKWTNRPWFKIDHAPCHVNKPSPFSINRIFRKVGFDGKVRPYTRFCTFPNRLVDRLPWLENSLLAFWFGLRFRGCLRKPQ